MFLNKCAAGIHFISNYTYVKDITMNVQDIAGFVLWVVMGIILIAINVSVYRQETTGGRIYGAVVLCVWMFYGILATAETYYLYYK